MIYMEESIIAFTNFLIHILIQRNLNQEKYLENTLVHLFLTEEILYQMVVNWLMQAFQTQVLD